MSPPWEGLPEAITERLRNLPNFGNVAADDGRKMATTIVPSSVSFIEWVTRCEPPGNASFHVKDSGNLQSVRVRAGVHVVTYPKTALTMEFQLDPAMWDKGKWTFDGQVRVSPGPMVTNSTAVTFGQVTLPSSLMISFYTIDKIQFAGTTLAGAPIFAIGATSRRQKTSELLTRMSPEKRALFEQIINIREKIGPVKIDLAKSIRELRENG